MSYQELRETATVTVADTDSLSSAVDLTGFVPIGIELPADIDSATQLTFQNSLDGTNYRNVYDSNNSEFTQDVDTARYVMFDAKDYLWAKDIKIRLGTSGTPVAATADRTLILLVRPI